VWRRPTAHWNDEVKKKKEKRRKWGIKITRAPVKNYCGWQHTRQQKKKTSLPFRMMAGKRRVTSGAAERHQSFSLSLLMSELGI
jgi:hypothetical protein